MKCKYCGQSAGLLSRAHTACEESHCKGVDDVTAHMQQFFQGREDFSAVLACKKRAETDHYLSPEDWTAICLYALRVYADSVTPPIGKQHLQTVDAFLSQSGVPRAELNRDGALDRLARHLYEGTLLGYFSEGQSMAKITQRAQMVTRLLPIGGPERQDCGLTILNEASAHFLYDGLVTPQEQAQFDEFAHTLSLPLQNLPAAYRGSDIEKVGQSAILRQLQNGQTPPPCPRRYPIMLAHGEYVIWGYEGVTLYQEKIVREWRGGRSGASFRIMKGVYYHTGGTKGRAVEHSEMENQGKGTLILTNQNVVFHSPTRTLKLPYQKINGCTPYSDGIELHQDTAQAQRLVLQGFDSWFMINLLSIIQ